mmetsp:Transcript_17788/g.49239  ORF Transcript_17788/g.49239 Transcript_17788/m.49239 type:complete len:229 (+) Transcript_17788:287-973(+)
MSIGTLRFPSSVLCIFQCSNKNRSRIMSGLGFLWSELMGTRRQLLSVSYEDSPPNKMDKFRLATRWWPSTTSTCASCQWAPSSSLLWGPKEAASSWICCAAPSPTRSPCAEPCPPPPPSTTPTLRACWSTDSNHGRCARYLMAPRCVWRRNTRHGRRRGRPRVRCCPPGPTLPRSAPRATDTRASAGVGMSMRSCSLVLPLGSSVTSAWELLAEVRRRALRPKYQVSK